MQLAIDTRTPANAELIPNSRQNHPECGRVEPRWACVRTHPQAERWAQANLNRLGYRTWLPIITYRRRDRVVRTLWHDEEAPAFGPYVFLRHTPGSPTTPIRYAPGVMALLKSGDNPAYTSDMAIEAAQKALETALHHGALPPPHPTPFWPVGTPCRLVDGQLLGMDAIVAGRRGGLVLCHVLLGNTLATVEVLPHHLATRD